MRAYAENILIEPIESDSNDLVEGTIVSLGELCPPDLKKTMKVVIGKYSGITYKKYIVVNYKEILIITNKLKNE